jgi:hypothetical protein
MVCTTSTPFIFIPKSVVNLTISLIRSYYCRNLVHHALDYSLVYFHVCPSVHASRLPYLCFLMNLYSSIPFSRMYSIYKRYENPYLSTFLGEIIGLSVLWLFWIVGTAIATVSDDSLPVVGFAIIPNTYPSSSHPQSMWGNIEWCQTSATSEACRILSALLAFSWLGWLVLSLLLGFSLLFSFANKGFMDPLHGRWNPRESHYPDTSSVVVQVRV